MSDHPQRYATVTYARNSQILVDGKPLRDLEASPELRALMAQRMNAMAEQLTRELIFGSQPPPRPARRDSASWPALMWGVHVS